MQKRSVRLPEEKRLMDWIMQTLTQLGEHFGLVLIACVELAAAVALLIKGQHKKKGTPIQTARGRGARDLLLQELDRRSDRVVYSRYKIRQKDSL